MVYLGEEDAVVAEGATAETCDLYSSRYVALVENRIGNIEIPLVQRAVTLSRSDDRRAVVFHSGGCFGDAAELADDYGIALITYRHERAILRRGIGWRCRSAVRIVCPRARVRARRF